MHRTYSNVVIVLVGRRPRRRSGSEAGADREDGGLDSVAKAELHEQVGDVGFHGRLADVELGADLGV